MLPYTHKADKAKIYAEKAMARITQEKLPALPPIFELWYVYYSGHNIDVVRTIDLMEQTKISFTEDRCRDLYNRLLNDARRSEEVLSKAEGIVAETMTNVSEAASAVKHKTQDYASEIELSASAMEGAKTADDIREVAQGMMAKAQRMVEENKALETQLVQSAQIMQQMRDEMELVRREALTDSMTGIANRKLFDAEISRLVGHSHQEAKPLSLLMIDIDHFKNFNDTYGHQVGDQVLKLVARTIKDGVKGRDLPARYGGEEFAVVLPETDAKGAEIVANALRIAVAEKDIINRTTGERLGKITLSVGTAQLKKGERPSSLIERADQALYTAKHAGRNRVISSEKLERDK